MPLVIDPTVQSQLDVLTKAREGLKAAKSMAEQAESILKLFPDDKIAARTKADATRMVAQFMKHAEAAGKIVRTLSKKTLPAALKKEADAAAKLIRARLVDPDALEVIPWQGQSIVRGGGVEYQMVFRLKGADGRGVSESQWVLTEDTGSATAVVDSWQHGSLRTRVTGKEFAANLLQALRGWAGIKGEDAANAAREPIAKAIASALNATVSAMARGNGETDQAEIENNGRTVSASYRSNLPKEGAYSVGEYEYDEMVSNEIARCRKVLDAKLAPYKDKIEKVALDAGEKSWININVYLK